MQFDSQNRLALHNFSNGSTQTKSILWEKCWHF